MFTGIVQGVAELVEWVDKGDFRTHVIRLPLSAIKGLELGASVAHNGCCLTVTAIDGDCVGFDLIAETLKLTNLGELVQGDRVNFERAAKFGDDIGGHLMSGHIVCTASVVDIYASEHNYQLWFELPKSIRPYILTKGFVGIDGVSLTIGEVRNDRFCVNLIPETLNRTMIQHRLVDDLVNIEIDPQTQAIVDTVERVMKNSAIDH